MSAPKTLLPQNLEAERSVLGGVLLENEKLALVAPLVTAEDFYRPAHGEIWRAMLALSERREPVDLVTLKAELEARGKLGEVGGAEALFTLDAFVPASGNLERYAKLVVETSRRRQLIAACREVAEKAQSGEGTLDALMDEAGQSILAVTTNRTDKGPEPVLDVLRRVYLTIEERMNRGEAITGLRTGFDKFDYMTAGMHRGEVIVLAGRPGTGKSALAMAIAESVAQQHKDEAVLFFEQEMSSDSLVQRTVSMVSDVKGSKLRNGQIDGSELDRVRRACTVIAQGSKLFLDDTAGATVLSIRSKARRIAAKHGHVGLIVIDYLQLMQGVKNAKGGNREQEIAEISRGLKQLAKELDCTVLALSQLNRSVEKRDDKRPMMSDLRESGQVEQDADVIAFIYRDELYNPETEDKGIAELIVAKQRSGSLGTVRLAFETEYTRFNNLPDDGGREWG